MKKLLFTSVALLICFSFNSFVIRSNFVNSACAAKVNTYAPIVKKVAASVVNIYAITKVRDPLFNDEFFRQFFGQDFNFGEGYNRDRLQSSLGSGVVVRGDGIIVTNYHVIGGGDEIRVVLSDKREFSAKVVAKDEQNDLVALKIEGKDLNLPFIELDDLDALEVGDIVLAIGNPFGLEQTVTSGIVSALNRTRVGKINSAQSFIQTDASINPGNSGGALVSAENGKLVGINTQIYSNTGTTIGIGFAIPASLIPPILASIDKGGKVIRPWFGAKLSKLSPNVAQKLKLLTSGVEVNKVFKGGLAALAGVKAGDIITQIDGKPLQDEQNFQFKIMSKNPGTKVILKVLRGVEFKDIVLTIENPSKATEEEAELKGNHALKGLVVANLTQEYLQEHNIDDLEGGIVVVEIKSGSFAEQLGIAKGDIILNVNRKLIKDPESLEKALKEGRNRLQLTLIRNGQKLSILFQTQN